MNPYRMCRLVLAVLLAAPIAAMAAGPQAPSAPAIAAGGVDSRETRDALTQVLERYPPELGSVLKLDPSLLRNEPYLAAYPELAAFVAGHPEVALQPGYYFENVRGLGWHDPRTPAQQMTMNVLGGLTGLTVFFVVTGVLAWLVKSLLAQRRWSHLARVQTEAHNKLLDRLASSEELLAYIQSPSGRRFLEAAPIPLDDEHRSLRAPIGRWLWSLQAGLVILAAGIGLKLMAGNAPRELTAAAVFVISIGVGFVLSAIAAYVVSRRLGLLAPPAPAAPGGHEAREER